MPPRATIVVLPPRAPEKPIVSAHVRRLAAIVLADVAEFSRLMGEDEEGTLDALKDVRDRVVDPAVARHGGRLVKTMGDGFLLEFASALAAVRCAIDILGAAAPGGSPSSAPVLRFRIGVNLGDIVVDGSDILGDGVNVAARLQALAEPGTICVSKAVRDAVRGKLDVDLESLGPQRVKNIAEPVEVYRIAAGASSPGRPGTRPRARPLAIRRIAPLAGLAALLAVGVAGWLALQRFGPPGPSSPPPLSVAIEPFAHDGSVAGQRWAGALGRHYATGLAGEMFVVVPMPAIGTGDAAARAAQAGNSRYRVEGEARPANDRVSVSARVVDVATGSQVVATQDTLDTATVEGPMSPALARIIRKARGAIVVADRQRALRQPESALTAKEWVLLAEDAIDKDHSLAGIRAARRFADRATELDPNLAAAWTIKARLVNIEGDVDPDQDRDRIGREQDAFSNRAITLDPADSGAWEIRMNALIYLSRWDGALEAAARVVRLEPHLPSSRLNEAWTRGLMGRPQEALAIVDEVVRADPEAAPGTARVACEAHVLAGQAHPAIAACEKSNLFAGDWISKVYLLAAYANNGESAKAAALRAEVLRDVPSYSIAQLRAKRYSDHPDYLVLAEKNWYSGLRRAGIPER